MSLLVTLNTEPDFSPETGKARPERLIAGDPLYKTWLLDEARDGSIRTGIWESTPGETHSLKGESFEFCYILSGRVEITENGGASVVYGPGDSFLMKPGFVGIWKTLETVRKIFVIAARRDMGRVLVLCMEGAVISAPSIAAWIVKCSKA